MSHRFTHTFFPAVILISAFLLHRNLSAQESLPLSNTQLLLNAVRLAGEELIYRLDTETIDSLCYQSVQDSTILEQLIHYQLQSALGQKQIALVKSRSAFLPSITVLIVSADLKYGKPFKKGFFGKKRIAREAAIGLMCHWEGVTAIQQSGMIQKSVCDTIAAGAIPIVEKNGLLPGYPVCPGATRWSWAEGLLSAGILSTVIYLFYAIRSQ